MCVFVPVLLRVVVSASACVCLRGKGEAKNQHFHGGRRALMDGSVLSSAKCNLTADFNEIYNRDAHFQTRCGVLAPA